MNLLHAMGSGIGLASGLGQLGRFGHRQPVIAICGDSTFFHSSLPGLVNAVYNSSNLLQIILDNDATAMTGFQAHPGVGYNAMGGPAKQIDIETLCQALGIPVETMDPFQTRQATRRIRELVNQGEGVRVLIMKRACELLRMKREKTARLTVRVDQEKCLGAKCAVCYRAFRCPAFVQDEASGKAVIKETACPGCGACIEVCPAQAISAVEEGS
jgi:indolepyruvate ferredoxin oxidoreductase alpha subunit